MAFFDDLKKNLTDKGLEAAQKAKDTAEVLQLRAQITGQKNQLEKLYGAIGALYYRKHRKDEQDEYATFFGEIEKTILKIRELQARVEELEGTQTCKNCGAVMKKTDAFCSKCGAAACTAEETPHCGEDETEIFEEEPKVKALECAQVEE